ncbi:hypothetical protein HNQ69_000251 [Bartonella callosciuri]|uniref:Uncharacterized protein n=1 Tax=Bartonella callosciuri TaxID=686223 RepID=A0A840NYI7_9HYPH|nr:hypothetical protein [Bartonella callosciuri]
MINEKIFLLVDKEKDSAFGSNLLILRDFFSAVDKEKNLITNVVGVLQLYYEKMNILLIPLKLEELDRAKLIKKPYEKAFSGV